MTASQIRGRYINRFGPPGDSTGQQVSGLHLSVACDVCGEHIIGLKQKCRGNQRQTMAKHLGRVTE